MVHHSTYLTTPPEWLGPRFMADAEHLRQTNEMAYRHEYLGEITGTGTNVFEFIEDREITDEEVAGFDRIYQGVDWGWYPDPFAFIRLYYDANRETIYLIDELYVNRTANSETGKWIIAHGYDDYQIICDSAEKKSVNDFRDMGLPATPAVKGPGSVEYGMKWLQKRRIVIDRRRTPNAFKEFTEYEYERNKQGEVLSGYPDRDNHIVDAVRYSLNSLIIRRGNSA